MTYPSNPAVPALARQKRPAPAGAVSASLTFAWRSLLKIKHVPEQLGDVIGIPILFTLMFTYLFGSALAGSTRSYLQYLLPGTLTLAVVFVTVYSGSPSTTTSPPALSTDSARCRSGDRRPSSAPSSVTPAATCWPPDSSSDSD